MSIYSEAKNLQQYLTKSSADRFWPSASKNTIFESQLFQTLIEKTSKYFYLYI